MIFCVNIPGFQSYAYSLSWPRQRRQKDIVFFGEIYTYSICVRKPALYFAEETEKGQESSFYVWLRDTIRAIIKRLFHVNVPMILVNKRLDYCREKFWGRITLNTALNIKPYFWIENVFLKKIKKNNKIICAIYLSCLDSRKTPILRWVGRTKQNRPLIRLSYSDKRLGS